MEHEAPLITLLAVGLVLAFVLGSLAWRVKLSPIVGYLLAGILAGPFTPGFVGDLELAPQLAEVGVILLMFGVGLHFSLDDLLKVRGIAIPGAVVQILVASALGWGLSQVLGWTLLQGLVFGLALSVASTVVLLRALEDQRLLDSKRGRIAVGWLIVEDLVMVLVLVLLPGLATALSSTGGALDWGPLLASLGWTLAKVVAFVALMLLVGRRVIPWVLERVAGTGERELFTLSVLAIALGIAVGSAHLFHVSYALGAFFAGMLLNESRLSHKAASDSLPMRDAFAVLFFVSVGMLFDPGVLVTHPLLVLATLLIIVLGKSVAAFAIVRAFGHPTNTALTIAASLAQIGEFSFILVGLGVSLAILPPLGRDLVLAGAILSIVLNPMLFAALSGWQRRRDARKAGASADPADAGPPLPTAGHTILVGYGRVGSQLARLLRDASLPVAVIDNDADLVRQAHLDGFPAIRGNAASADRLAELSPAGAGSALLAIPEPLEAGEIIGRLRAANPAMIILARAHGDAEMQHLLAEGADGAVLAERELAFSMAEMIVRANAPRPAGAREV
jgi:CPA2 family monovalent cation:H+ antiporter-2